MKPKTLLLLTGLTALLGAFIFFYERDLPSTEERREAAAKVLDLVAEDVDRLTLDAGDGAQPVVLVRKTADAEDPSAGEAPPAGSEPAPIWHLESPFKARADSDAVGDLLQSLVALPKSRDLDGADEAQLGLDNPSRTVLLQGPKGERRLAVGDLLPLSGDRALQREDGRILQGKIDDDLVARLGRPGEDWRDKRLFLASRSAVEGLTLEQGGRRIVFRRAEVGETFRLVEPLQDAADGELLRGLLTAVTRLEASAFAQGPAEHGLSPGWGSIELQLGPDHPPWRAEIAAPPESDGVPAEIWIRPSTALHEDEVTRIDDTALLEALRRPVNDWRSKRWTTFQVFSTQRASFEGPELAAPIRLERRDGEWRRVDGDTSSAIEYTAASDALYPVTEARAVTLLERHEAELRFELSTPRLTVTLGNDSREDVLHLYSAAGAETAAGLEGRDAILLIPTQTVDAWLPWVRALPDAPAPALPPSP